MFSRCNLGRVIKGFLLVAILTLSVFMSSCARESQVPKEVRETLFSLWESLPSSSTIEHRIVRAWEGDPQIAETEIWCVEAEVISSEDTDLIGEQMIWIVVRDYEDTSWSASLLAAMSSIWPYEACGTTPFNLP